MVLFEFRSDIAMSVNGLKEIKPINFLSNEQLGKISMV